MRKRSLFLALGTALALVVLTAGLALASGRWDTHHASGYATGHQVSTSIQPKAQEPSGTVRSTGPRTGWGWCDQTGMPAWMATKTATGHPACVAHTSTHRSSVNNVQATTRPTTTTTARSSRQPRSGSTSRWMGRHTDRDGRCWDSWR